MVKLTLGTACILPRQSIRTSRERRETKIGTKGTGDSERSCFASSWHCSTKGDGGGWKPQAQVEDEDAVKVEKVDDLVGPGPDGVELWSGPNKKAEMEGYNAVD